MMIQIFKRLAPEQDASLSQARLG